MSALRYKQTRQLINAVRRSFAGPRQALALLIALAYGLASLLLVVALLVLPLPEPLRGLIGGVLGAGALAERLSALRGGLTLTLLLLAATAAFQNPLLQVARADIDLLLATPVPAWRVMLGRMLLNHLRTLLAGYFFWGLAAAPALRLLGYAIWPAGAWALAGLACLFAAVDQGMAWAQIALRAGEVGQEQRQSERPAPAAPAPPARWGGAEADGLAPHRLLLTRAMLLVIAAALLLLAAGGLAWLAGGDRAPLDALLALAAGPLAALLLPLGMAGDLLLLPLRADPAGAALALGGLAALDLLSGLLLLRLLARGGGGLLLETLLAPQAPRLAELLRAHGPRPWRIAAALWAGSAAPPEAASAAAPPRPRRARLHGAAAQIWRRGLEIRRSPWRSGLAVLLLGLAPLAIFGPERGYSLPRLLTAIVFSTSLSTQLFNDAADHLRYANLELTAPAPRHRHLLAAMLPRLALYWAGGLVLLLGVGLRAPGADWGELLALALWYPLVLAPLLSLRAALVFLWPAAGIPGQRDPVQGLIVLLANGLLVLAVIGLSLLPFGVVLTLIGLIGLSRAWLWPVVFAVSAALALLCVGGMGWAYGRYEPAEQ